MTKQDASDSVSLGGGLVLRSPGMRDLDRYLWFTNELANEKKANSELAIVSPDQEISKAEAKRQLGTIVASIKSEDLVFVGAFDGTALVGTCEIHRSRALEMRHTGLLAIALLKGYRGQGLGHVLTKEALARGKALGMTLVELHVFSSNAPAMKLYEKEGFRLVGKIPKMIWKNGRYIDDVIMYADLGGNDKPKGQLPH